MNSFYTSELSKMVKVSKRTLYHYDNIDLLKPSVRLSNGYRVYSQEDVAILKRIIVYKYFGFPLSKIKTLLTSSSKEINTILAEQLKVIKKKSQEISKTKSILEDFISNNITPEENLIWNKTADIINNIKT